MLVLTGGGIWGGEKSRENVDGKTEWHAENGKVWESESRYFRRRLSQQCCFVQCWSSKFNFPNGFGLIRACGWWRQGRFWPFWSWDLGFTVNGKSICIYWKSWELSSWVVVSCVKVWGVTSNKVTLKHDLVCILGLVRWNDSLPHTHRLRVACGKSEMAFAIER